MELEYLDGSNAQIYTFLDTKQDKLYAMKYIDKERKKSEFDFNPKEFDQEVKILEIIKKNNIENIIAKQIYNDRDNVCIWLEQGQCNLEKFSLERVRTKDFWHQDELLNLTL